MTADAAKEKLFIVLHEAAAIQRGRRKLTRNRLANRVSTKYQIGRGEAKELIKLLIEGNMLVGQNGNTLRVAYPIEFLRF